MHTDPVLDIIVVFRIPRADRTFAKK